MVRSNGSVIEAKYQGCANYDMHRRDDIDFEVIYDTEILQKKIKNKGKL